MNTLERRPRKSTTRAIKNKRLLPAAVTANCDTPDKLRGPLANETEMEDENSSRNNEAQHKEEECDRL
jgi:hypothetical protein